MYGGTSLLGLYSEDRFEFRRGDVCDAQAVQQSLEGIEAVVHLAAIVGDPACARQPDLVKRVNLEASLALLDLCQRRGVSRLVFASTCSNYGRMLDPEGYVNEESPLRPVSLYAETKVAVEQALLGASNGKGCAPMVLRFATLFGLSPRPRFDLTVNEFTMELLTKRELVVYGQQFWRPYVHVRDAARAIGRVLELPVHQVERKVYNVGDTTQNFQKQQIVDMVRAQVHEPVDVKYVHKVEDPRDYRVSFERIHRELGFAITRTVNDGIAEVASAIQQRVITDPSNPLYRN